MPVFSVAGMQSLGTVGGDVAAVEVFVSQVRVLCARLTANPFNTAAAEALLDLLLEGAPAADMALARVLDDLVGGPGTEWHRDAGSAVRSCFGHKGVHVACVHGRFGTGDCG